MKVENFYNKNQFIIRGDGNIVFQSYESTIAVITEDGDLILGIDWNFSKTTSKYLYLFLNDFQYDLKKETKTEIERVLNSSNKRNAIQKLIDNGIIKIIKYNEYLK